MFTGLVIEMGEIVSLIKKDTGARLFLKTKAVSSDAKTGDSISVNGTCLTVVEIRDNILAFDLSAETLKSTDIGQLKVRDRVNLEPALKIDSRLGGHFVTGHVDGVGKIKSKDIVGDAYKIIISASEYICGFLVEKGSVAIDGISLTVVDVFKDKFSIVIIPHTARLTTIGYKKSGDLVNIEVDILGKYVSKFLDRHNESGFKRKLLEEGFI